LPVLGSNCRTVRVNLTEDDRIGNRTYIPLGRTPGHCAVPQVFLAPRALLEFLPKTATYNGTSAVSGGTLSPQVYLFQFARQKLLALIENPHRRIAVRT